MKSVYIDKSALKKAVTLSKKVLPKVVFQEERGHLLCSVEESSMKICSTNSDSAMQLILAVKNEEKNSFSFTLDPKKADKLLAKIDLEEIKIEYDEENYDLKIYTTEAGGSVSNLDTFPPERMLSFKDPSSIKRSSTVVDKEAFIFSMNYAKSYLPPLKEDHKKFDFIVIDRGIVYSANGANKMGFVVFKCFSSLEKIKIRKVIVPLLISAAQSMEGDTLKIIETEKDLGIESEDGSVYYSALKSNVEAPDIMKDYIKSEGAYTKIDKSRLIKVIDRLMVTSSNLNTGVILSLDGKEESALLTCSVVGSEKSKELFNCQRINDGEDKIDHLVDYHLFKSILSSFDTKDEVRLHINDKDSKFFKIYNNGDVKGNKYILAGIGAYSRLVS